jgi:hypothetical protein
MRPEHLPMNRPPGIVPDVAVQGRSAIRRLAQSVHPCEPRATVALAPKALHASQEHTGGAPVVRASRVTGPVCAAHMRERGRGQLNRKGARTAALRGAQREGGAARTRRPGRGPEPCEGTAAGGRPRRSDPWERRSGPTTGPAASQATERSRMRSEGAQLERERGRGPAAHGRAAGKAPRVTRA